LRNNDYLSQFKITLSNRYQSLQDESDISTENSSYKHFERARAFAAEEILPVQLKAKRKVPWESEDIASKCEDLKIVGLLSTYILQMVIKA